MLRKVVPKSRRPALLDAGADGHFVWSAPAAAATHSATLAHRGSGGPAAAAALESESDLSASPVRMVCGLPNHLVTRELRQVCDPRERKIARLKLSSGQGYRFPTDFHLERLRLRLCRCLLENWDWRRRASPPRRELPNQDENSTPCVYRSISERNRAYAMTIRRIDSAGISDRLVWKSVCRIPGTANTDE